MSSNETPGALLDYVSRPEYEPLTQRQLIHRLNVPREVRPRVRRMIRALLTEGKLVEGPGGRLLASTPGRVVGTLHRHPGGYGFVVPEQTGPDVFIAPPNLGDNLTGDRVVARVTRAGRGNRMEGVIVRTLKHRSRRMLGVFFDSAGGGNVQPFETGFGQPVHVPRAFAGGAVERQVVQFELMSNSAPGSPAQGKVLQVLGDLDAKGMDARVMLQKYGLPPRFPSEVSRWADRLPPNVGERQAAERTRPEGPEAVTIDGETAKDLDDAIAVQELPGGGFRLSVHIADVAHFVAPGDTLDVEARRRGTSVYFPDRVLPMLPRRLSNGLCSLRPGVDRLVQSVIIDFDSRGEVEGSRFLDAVLRSAARLTYTQVARVVEGDAAVRGVPKSVVGMLEKANELSRLLERRRHARGSVDFDLPEPQILLDVEGAMTGVTIEPRNRAHRMIEEFMIAANEVVARYLDDKVGVCLYRVHDRPDAVKLETLAHFVERFGVSFPVDPEQVRPAQFQRLVELVEGRPEAKLVNGVALRSMKQARYSPDNIGHFSLASPCYCHFTSPIRRYPDLVVHRLLRAARGGERITDEQRDELAAIAERCSELERNAESAERELLQWKKVAFAEDKVGERYDAVVTGVAAFGLFLQLEANLVEGLVRVEHLGDERFEYDATRQVLRGGRSGRLFHLGDRLGVRIVRVDRVLQRVDLALARSPGPPGRRGVE